MSSISLDVLDPTQLVTVLRDDGTIDPALDPGLSSAELLLLYRSMVETRLLDERMIALQRQGRIGFHVGSMGEEGTIIGSAFAMRAQDWLFPCYREFGAALLRGLPLQVFVDNLFGNARDVVRGRQMPHHVVDKEHHFASVSSPVGTQIPHAVGVAWAAKLRKEDVAALVYFGEGATSSNDFHAGMNLAAVSKAPVVFLCRNNGWAISVPADKQTASPTFAAKALAYGMPGVRVDGNDVVAVVRVVRDAIARGAAGEGPTLIEAYTYRTGGHSTSDDPGRYRNADELAPWVARDPIQRLRTLLVRSGALDAATDEAIRTDLERRFRAAVESAEHASAPTLDTMFDDVFAQRTWVQEEQLAELMAGPRPVAPH